MQTLSASGQSALPQVAVDADGDAVFTWTRFDGTNDRVQARARSAAGALSDVQDLSDPGHNAGYPQVAVDADGDAVFTWRRSDGANAPGRGADPLRRGRPEPLTTLSDPGQSAFLPQVAVDAEGDALVAWEHFDETNVRVQASAGP